jgi:hypothetical protein
MSKQQEYILWIGIFLLLVYLFTDVNVRDLIFNRGSGAVSQTNTFAADIQAGLPSSTGNTHSNTGNTGSVTLA